MTYPVCSDMNQITIQQNLYKTVLYKRLSFIREFCEVKVNLWFKNIKYCSIFWLLSFLIVLTVKVTFLIFKLKIQSTLYSTVHCLRTQLLQFEWDSVQIWQKYDKAYIFAKWNKFSWNKLPFLWRQHLQTTLVCLTNTVLVCTKMLRDSKCTP